MIRWWFVECLLLVVSNSIAFRFFVFCVCVWSVLIQLLISIGGHCLLHSFFSSSWLLQLCVYRVYNKYKYIYRCSEYRGEKHDGPLNGKTLLYIVDVLMSCWHMALHFPLNHTHLILGWLTGQPWFSTICLRHFFLTNNMCVMFQSLMSCWEKTLIPFI